MKLISKFFSFLIVFMFMGTTYFYYDNYVKGSEVDFYGYLPLADIYVYNGEFVLESGENNSFKQHII